METRHAIAGGDVPALGPPVSGLLAAVLLLAVASASAAAAMPEPFAIPIERAPLALGAGYDSELRAARGEPGACVTSQGTEERAADGPRWTVATLTRAGGRLVVGVHVAAPVTVEVLANATLSDAARRLGRADPASFRDLCGDGFIAARTHGGQWLAEVEVERADVGRALATLTTGTWSDPEPFREAFEAWLQRYRVRARELPGGSRADARPMPPDELVSRAIAFPETVTAETGKPVVATFEPYGSFALSGVALPAATEIDPREVAERVFRAGQPPASDRAQRAADLRAAQVQRSSPEPPPASPPASPAPASVSGPVVAAVPLQPVPAAPGATAPAARGAASLRKQAALVFTGTALSVFATTRAPSGVYAERVREREYWVPGAATATPAVEEAIARAKAEPPTRGTTVVIAEVGATEVVMTDAPPLAGIHSEPAGERRAWIAGVSQPDAEQRAALAAAVRADAESP